MLCLTDIKPRGLIIFPKVQELCGPIAKANKSTPLLWVNVGASEFKFDITPAAPAPADTGATLVDEDTGGSSMG